MVRSKERYQRAMSVLLKKERRKRERLKELGIDYEFPGYVSTLSCSNVNNIVMPFLRLLFYQRSRWEYNLHQTMNNSLYCLDFYMQWCDNCKIYVITCDNCKIYAITCLSTWGAWAFISFERFLTVFHELLCRHLCQLNCVYSAHAGIHEPMLFIRINR